MDLTTLWQEVQNAIDARAKYNQQIERATRLLWTMREIFSCPFIFTHEITVPLDREEIECKHKGHAEHALTLVNLEIIHKHEDGTWDYGEDSLDPVSMLQLISKKGDSLIHAVKMFQKKEQAKTKEVKDFLDIVEEALQPIVIAKNLSVKK